MHLLYHSTNICILAENKFLGCARIQICTTSFTSPSKVNLQSRSTFLSNRSSWYPTVQLTWTLLPVDVILCGWWSISFVCYLYRFRCKLILPTHKYFVYSWFLHVRSEPKNDLEILQRVVLRWSRSTTEHPCFWHRGCTTNVNVLHYISLSPFRLPRNLKFGFTLVFC